MSKKFGKILGILAAGSLIAGSLLAFIGSDQVSASGLDGKGGPGGNGGQGKGIGVADSGQALTPLSSAEVEAIQQAILEEYGAYNLYQSVVNQLGNVYPFSQIVQSEQQHINALTRQAVKYGVTVPENPGSASTVSFSSLSDACQAGVTAEIADADLYDELNPVITHGDILQVFDRLQSASLNSHLPAFQTCQ